MTDPEALAHPNYYLKRAQQMADTVRAWIQRTVPAPREPEADDVGWVMGSFKELDRCIARAIESADYRLPNASSPQVVRVRREASNRRDADLHQLKRVDDSIRDILRWAHSARWSTGVSGDDLDKLESLARQAKTNLVHVLAAAQDAALEQ